MKSARPNAQRDASIVKDYQDGMPKTEIAKKYGRTTDRVRQIINTSERTGYYYHSSLGPRVFHGSIGFRGDRRFR